MRRREKNQYRNRNFSKDTIDDLKEKKRFPFPFELDEEHKKEYKTNESIKKEINAEAKTSSFKNNTERSSYNSQTRRSVKRPSSYTITKARTIPSAVHGTKNPGRKDIDETEIYREKFKNHKSPLIDQIVEEREAKEEKKRSREQRLEEERRKEEALKEKLNSRKKTSHNDDDLKKERQLVQDKKRIGPSRTLPPISVLGELQNDNYVKRDNEYLNDINQILKHIGIDGKATEYISNGVVGAYTVQLDRHFKLSQIDNVKAQLETALGKSKVRIISEILGDNNIQIEFPLDHVKDIYYKSLFLNSSLKLRKNDYKFAIGKTVDNRIFSYELRKAGHILIYGNNEQQTSIVDNILVSLLMNHSSDEFKFKFITDEDTFRQYERLPHNFGARNSILNKDALSDIIDELNDRNIQFRRAHVRNIQSFNTRVKQDSKKSTIIVYIDKIDQLFDNNNPEVVRAILQILKQGKALGIHLVLNHTTTEVGIRYELQNMLQTKISYFDPKHQVIDGAEKLFKGNDILITIPTSNRPVRLNTSIITEDVIENIVNYVLNTEDES